MKTFCKIFLLVVAAAVIAGCTTRLTDFTMITTKNVDLSRVADFKRGNKRVTGEDTMYIILFIPTKAQPNMKEAIDEAIESVPGCVALVDGVLYSKNAYFLLGGFASFVVEGTPLIDPKLSSSLPSRYVVVSYEESTGRYVPNYVTENQYKQLKQKIDDEA